MFFIEIIFYSGGGDVEFIFRGSTISKYVIKWLQGEVFLSRKLTVTQMVEILSIECSLPFFRPFYTVLHPEAVNRFKTVALKVWAGTALKQWLSKCGHEPL
jgi:hypothetical protein